MAQGKTASEPPAPPAVAPALPKIVQEIVQFNADRKPKAVAIKYQRMATDAFVFYRGTLHCFARQWREFQPPVVGPDLLSCGDLHLENFGAYETDDGVFCYDINDFDEALVAPAAFDLVRCTGSIFLAADIWPEAIPQPEDTARLFLAQYRTTLTQVLNDRRPGEITLEHGRGAIWELLGRASLSTTADLLDRHTTVGKKGVRRILRDDGKHPELSDDRVAKVTQAVESYGRGRGAKSAFRVLDVTGRIVGVGSLGVRRALVLIEGQGSSDGNFLLDIKEAVPSTAAPWVGHALNHVANEAQRVVDAQRIVQARPTAGLDALLVGKIWHRMRAMVPDENRSKLDRLRNEPEQLRQAIVAAGQLVAWGHFRGAVWQHTTKELATYLAGPGLDEVFQSASQAAAFARRDYSEYRQAFAAGRLPVATEGSEAK